MLYISRFVGRASYGVVDTDDGTESVIGMGELLDALETLGGVIIGADSVIVAGSIRRRIESIRPYQTPGTKNQLQLKTSLLKHIDVLTYGSTVTSVRIRSDEITSPVSIRLSDFGSLCADGAFRCLTWTGKHKVTIVIDDNIAFSEYSFDLPVDDSSHSLGVDGAGIVFDLREVTNPDVYKAVYSAVWDRNELEVERSIIDRVERKAKMMKAMSGWVKVF